MSPNRPCSFLPSFPLCREPPTLAAEQKPPMERDERILLKDNFGEEGGLCVVVTRCLSLSLFLLSSLSSLSLLLLLLLLLFFYSSILSFLLLFLVFLVVARIRTRDLLREKYLGTHKSKFQTQKK